MRQESGASPLKASLCWKPLSSWLPVASDRIWIQKVSVPRCPSCCNRVGENGCALKIKKQINLNLNKIKLPPLESSDLVLHVKQFFGCLPELLPRPSQRKRNDLNDLSWLWICSLFASFIPPQTTTQTTYYQICWNVSCRHLGAALHFSKAGLAQCCWAGNLIVGDIWRHMVTSFPGWIWLKNRGIPQSLKGFDQSQTSHFVSTYINSHLLNPLPTNTEITKAVSCTLSKAAWCASVASCMPSPTQGMKASTSTFSRNWCIAAFPIVHPPLSSAQLHSELAKIYQILPGNQVSIFAACKKDKPGFRASDQTEVAVRHRKSKPSNYSMAAVRICKVLRTCAYNLGMFVYKSK